MNDTLGWILLGIAIIFLIALLRKGRKLGKAPRLRVAFFLNQIKIEGNNMALTMTNIQQATGKIRTVNAQGEPAGELVADSVDYNIDDPELVDIIEDPEDQSKLTVVSKTKTGVGTLKITAKALDEQGNEVDLEETVAIEIRPAGVVGFGIVFDPPTDVPAV